MRLAWLDRLLMRMFVMLVVGMTGFVDEIDARENAHAFAEMQPNSESHQGTG
jgi:hypothetical protein